MTGACLTSMAPAMFAKHSLAAGLFASALLASCAPVQKAAQKPSVKFEPDRHSLRW